MRALLLALLLLAMPAVADDPDFAALRADLVDEVRTFAGYAGDDPFNDEVLATIGRVERHRFVPPGQAAHAYENRPLPIGHGQTISHAALHRGADDRARRTRRRRRRARGR
jgi:protein-L-isoaspartate(D-aspartate) O-methyltransferase